jgi:hypothetical protein
MKSEYYKIIKPKDAVQLKKVEPQKCGKIIKSNHFYLMISPCYANNLPPKTSI